MVLWKTFGAKGAANGEDWRLFDVGWLGDGVGEGVEDLVVDLEAELGRNGVDSAVG